MKMKDRKFTYKKTNESESNIFENHKENNKDGCLTYTDPVHGNNFLKKLYDLYKREELCDVKLFVGEKFISTHRSVLASNSPYFEGKIVYKMTSTNCL